MFNKKEFMEKLIAKATAETLELECIFESVVFVKEGKSHVLRVTVDGEKATLEACATISRRISGWLDEFEAEIPFKEYMLEVTTPGIDRPLKSYEDFKKLIGKLVFIETKSKAEDGRKRYKGRVSSVDEEKVKLYIEEESADFYISIDDIKKSHLEFEF